MPTAASDHASNGKAKGGSTSFSPVVSRIDSDRRHGHARPATEATPLVADSIDSWGLRGHYEMPSARPEPGWCVPWLKSARCLYVRLID